jgi:hypothetical protein
MKLLKKLFGWGFGFIALTFVALTFMSGSRYDTDVPPPAQNAKLNEIFLKEFQGIEPKLDKLDLDGTRYLGYKATYGSKATITVIKAKSVEIGNDYFKTELVPVVDSYNNHSRAKVNGRWYGKGSDKSGVQWYGWMNNNWIFVLHTSDEQTLDTVVDLYPYISQ